MSQPSAGSSTALSPSVIAAIDDLELTARLIVEGLRAGGHRSPFHGFSAEFRQHRPYRQGDDLRHLDWKLYGRSDRLYTRQFLDTTNLSLLIVLDTSASMAFPAAGLSKFRYGVVAAAALAYLAVEQGNAVGMMTMANGALAYVPPRGGRMHLRSVIARLDQLVPGGRWDAARVLSRGAQLLRRRGVVIVISDFYDDEEITRRELRRIARRGHDVAMLQLTSPPEQTLPYQGQIELEDLESGERRIVDAAATGRAYRASVAAFLARGRTAALRDGIEYALISTATPPEDALREYLVRRGGRPRAGHTARATRPGA